MFSGIIEHQAKILQIQEGLFRVENTFWEILSIWQSVAHDGACMTITHATEDFYEFFVMQESLHVTNFGLKRAGDFFNVERSIRVGDRIDGSFVSGHVDATASVLDCTTQSDESMVVSIERPQKFAAYTIRKWSITLNGVNLTIVDDTADSISVSLIPLTQSFTNLGKLTKGNTVNVEFDMMGKYVQKLYSQVL
jgi:riboflavin synthase